MRTLNHIIRSLSREYRYVVLGISGLEAKIMIAVNIVPYPNILDSEYEHSNTSSAGCSTILHGGAILIQPYTAMVVRKQFVRF